MKVDFFLSVDAYHPRQSDLSYAIRIISIAWGLSPGKDEYNILDTNGRNNTTPSKIIWLICGRIVAEEAYLDRMAW